MKIKAIVPAYNEEKNIINLMKSIYDSDIPGKVAFNCTVVCNGCTDGTFKRASEYSKGRNIFKIIELKERHKAKSINKVLEKTSKDTICIIIDADTCVSKNFIDNIYKKFSKYSKVHVIGADYVPNLKKLPIDSYLYKYEVAEHYERLINPSTIPIGSFLAFKKADFPILPENISSDDSYIVLDSWARFGRSSVICDTSIKSKYFPPTNWIDLITQRTRWIQGTNQLIEKYPKLEIPIKEKGIVKNKSIDKWKKKLIEKLTRKGLSKEDIEGIAFIRSKVVNENSKLGPQLITDEGKWDVNPSTKEK